MFFVALHKPYKGQADELMIRADLILEISTRRQTKKAREFDPEDTTEEGAQVGTWVLVDRLGWTPVTETPAEVAEAIVAAEVAYRARLAAVTAK